MTEEIITESYGTPVKRGRRWYVTVARPGKGNKGNYPEDVLKNTGPVAIPAKTKAFWKHPDKDANGKPKDRDPRDQVGVYEEGAFWNEEEGELGAFLTPFPRYEKILEEAKDNIEASIHVLSRNDGRGNVVELLPYRANTVDLVAFGGIEGAGLKYQVESLFEAAAADFEIEEKEENMEITKEMWDGLNGHITDLASKFDTFATESLTEKQGKADADAVSAAVATQVEEALANYAEVEKSINDADIFGFAKESLKARARKGEDISEDLAGAVSMKLEALKEITPDVNPAARANVVVVNESLDESGAPASFTPKNWSSR